MKLLLPPLSLAVLATMIQTASAAVAVSWGVSTGYVTTSQQFANLDTAGMRLGGFSGGDPLQLSPTTDYTGGTFYGAVTWTATGSDGNYGAVEQRTGGDTIEIKRFNADIQAVVLWRQADFMNGLNSSSITFDAASTASMNLTTCTNFDPGRVVIRLQGGPNDGYSISQETPYDGTGPNEANLTSLTWQLYDPAASMSTFGAVTPLVSGGLISNVTEVGFYTSSSATAANAFRAGSFEVTAVPETTSVILAGLGFGGLCIRRKRK